MEILPKGRKGRLRATLVLAIPLGSAAGIVHLATWMPGRSFDGVPGPLPPELADLPDRLASHVTHLATTIGARSENAPKGLAEAEQYLSAGLAVSAGAVLREAYAGRKGEVANLVMERRGNALPEQIIVIGAHYDAVDGTPGADDNASGCAALIELARLTVGVRYARTVRFVAWVNEEPPSFQTESMGSLVSARASRARGEDIRLALSLETVGFFTDEPESQHYPSPFSLFYPDVGNFIGMVGNVASRDALHHALTAFRGVGRIPSEGVAFPDVVPGIGWSDHWSYWQAGYPALMVTDTAPFRNPSYHDATDDPADLDYTRMARVVEGMLAVIQEAADR
ncbi:MAG: M28 family peptidase [Pseudomonadota bacterium]|nr:M28 family peptidase [Pseudomonadota bacterium]